MAWGAVSHISNLRSFRWRWPTPTGPSHWIQPDSSGLQFARPGRATRWEMRGGQSGISTAAVTLKPDVDNYYQRGATYQTLDEHALAIADMDQVIELRPGSAIGLSGSRAVAVAPLAISKERRRIRPGLPRSKAGESRAYAALSSRAKNASTRSRIWAASCA